MAAIGTQIPLAISPDDGATFSNFIVGDNAQLVNSLRAIAQGQGEQFTYLWGETGTGRSHLLQAICHSANEHGLKSVYLPLHQMMQHGPALLDGMENIHVVCIHHIECIAGDAAWEEALFHLYNRMRACGHRLIMVGNKAVNHLAICLADLVSRLHWGVRYHLRPLSDSTLLEALQLRAKARGLILGDEAGLFIIRRFERNMSVLYTILERLDQASLAAQRRLTVPFIKQALAL